MNRYLTSRDFLSAFSTQWALETRDWERVDRAYSDDGAWTSYMLSADNGFLYRVMQSLSPDLRYGREYYAVDALYVGGRNLIGWGSYPSEIHALIEHENRKNVEEEMWKLLQWRAPLKIIFMYDFHDIERDVSQVKRDWLPEKLELLRNMARASHRFYPEPDPAEYLFVIGSRRADRSIYWRFVSSDDWVVNELALPNSEPRAPQNVVL